MISEKNKKKDLLTTNDFAGESIVSEEQNSDSSFAVRQSKRFSSAFLRIVLFTFFCCSFFILFYYFIDFQYFQHIKTSSQAFWFCLTYTSIFVLCLLLLYILPGIKSFTGLFILSSFAVIYFFTHLTLFDFIPKDAQLNLIPLIESFSESSVLTIGSSSYTAFSQSLLFAFSKMPLNPYYIFRILSVLGNVILACGVFKIFTMWNDNKYAGMSVLAGTMFLPQLILPFSFEFSLFAAFAVFALYYLINARPYTASVYLALSLALSKAGLLLLPLILIMMFVRQFKLRHVLLFLVFFALSFVPPYLLGANLFSSALTYIGDIYSNVSYAPNLYAFFGSVKDSYMFINLAFCLTAAFVLSVISYSFINRKILDQRSIISLMLILCLGTAYLIPVAAMHCFLFAAVLSVAYLCLGKQKIYISAIILIFTFIPLCVSLFDISETSLMFCSVGIIAAFILTVRELITYINNEKIKLYNAKEI